MLDSKNNAIKDLQYELARVCKVRLSPALYFVNREGGHPKIGTANLAAFCIIALM